MEFKKSSATPNDRRSPGCCVLCHFQPEWRSGGNCTSERYSRALGRRERRAISRFAGHDGPVQRTFFGPGGDDLVTVSADGTTRLWRADPGYKSRRFEGSGPLKDAVFAPKPGLLAMLCQDGTVTIWETENARCENLRLLEVTKSIHRWTASITGRWRTVPMASGYWHRRLAPRRSGMSRAARKLPPWRHRAVGPYLFWV